MKSRDPKEIERRLELMASSSIVGADVRWALDEIAKLRSAAPAVAPPRPDGEKLLETLIMAIGQYSTEICRPDAELAPPQYLRDAWIAVGEALRAAPQVAPQVCICGHDGKLTSSDCPVHAQAAPSGEITDPLALANSVLNRVNADPDEDLAILARQFLRWRHRGETAESALAAQAEQITSLKSELGHAEGIIDAMEAQAERVQQLEAALTKIIDRAESLGFAATDDVCAIARAALAAQGGRDGLQVDKSANLQGKSVDKNEKMHGAPEGGREP